MKFEPPQPPTAPAPAVRPTPPTPPKIDMTPFSRDKVSESAVSDKNSPEAQARDAVAHGSGALTKRTVERNDKPRDDTPRDDTQSKPNQTVTVIPPDAPIVSDGQSDYDRGQDVLRQFREIDSRDSQSPQNFPAHTSTEQPRHIAPTINHQQEGHGAGYWLFTIIFMGVAAFVIVKKFLLTDKPALTKSQIFSDESRSNAPAKSARMASSTEKLKATVDKPKPVKPSPKPLLTPPKDDDKGKRFEVRV